MLYNGEERRKANKYLNSKGKFDYREWYNDQSEETQKEIDQDNRDFHWIIQ